jgi:hypothetical protein
MSSKSLPDFIDDLVFGLMWVPDPSLRGRAAEAVFRWRLAALWSEQRCAEKWRESAPVKRGAQSIL